MAWSLGVPFNKMEYQTQQLLEANRLLYGSMPANSFGQPEEAMDYRMQQTLQRDRQLYGPAPGNPFADKQEPQAAPDSQQEEPIRMDFETRQLLYGPGPTNPFGSGDAVQEAVQQTSGPQQSESLKPIKPKGWTLDEAPVALRIPAGYDPANPDHQKAYQEAEATATNPKTLGTFAGEYLTSIEGQKGRVQAAQKAVADSLAELNGIKSTLASGGKQMSTPDYGRVTVPLTNREIANLNVRLGTAEEKYKASKAALEEGSAPIGPKIIDVTLPKPPEPPAEAAPAPAKEPEQKPQGQQSIDQLEDIPLSRQQIIYNANVQSLNNWAMRQIARGVKHEAVNAFKNNAMDSLKASMKPEYRQLGDGLYYFKDPSSEGVKVEDRGVLRREIYSENVKQFDKQMQNLNEIDAMARMADEAAKLKPGDKQRAAYITALGAATKAINTAIAGTSDAVSLQEYNRVASSLNMGIIQNPLQAFNQDSIGKMFGTNPEGFAAFAREIRNIAANRSKGNYATIKSLEKRVGIPLQEVPDWYLSAISKDKGITVSAEEVRSALGARQQNKGTSFKTQGGLKLNIR